MIKLKLHCVQNVEPVNKSRSSGRQLLGKRGRFEIASKGKAPLKLNIVMSETKKILIVDDEQDVLTYFEAIFQDNGYDTVSAKDGIEGFELAKSEKPDLIVLDVAMPQQSGLKTYRQYKRHSALTNIPVIIITAVDDSFRIFLDELKELGPPEGIFNKPINPQELLKVVAEILSD